MKSASGGIRQRAFTIVAIVCGALAATIIWQQTHPRATISDSASKSLGFASSSDRDSAHELFAKARRDKRLSDKDFEQAKRAIMNGSSSAAEFAIEAFGSLEGGEQYKKAFAVLNAVGVNDHTKPFWLLAVRGWMRSGNSNVVSDCAASTNPSVRSLAEELGHASQK